MMAKGPSLQTFVYRLIFKEDYHLVKILYKYIKGCVGITVYWSETFFIISLGFVRVYSFEVHVQGGLLHK